MIRETSVEISYLHKRWQRELELRYARRNKIRYIDYLLNELEMLNLSESRSMTPDVRHKVKLFLDANEHPLSNKRERDLGIAASMEALYDIQDTLLLGSEDEEEV
jgi:hypothetical protein